MNIPGKSFVSVEIGAKNVSPSKIHCLGQSDLVQQNLHGHLLQDFTVFAVVTGVTGDY